jgi:hypothetical protein
MSKRRRKEPNYLKNYFVTTTTSFDADNNIESKTNSNTQIKDKWMIKYFQIMDTLVINLEKQSLKIAIKVDNFFKLDFANST